MQARTVGQSFFAGLVISAIFALAPAIPMYLTFHWWAWEWLTNTLTAATFLGTMVFVLYHGYANIRIPVGQKGVRTRFGDKPTGAVLTEGDHFAFAGLGGAIPVDTRHRRIDLDPSKNFTTLAADSTHVNADVFILGHVENPPLWLGADNPEESIREELEASIVMFAGAVKLAESAINFRYLLARYLELEPRNTDAYTPEHQRCYDDLYKLRGKIQGGKKAIETLLRKDNAGKLKRIARAWGFRIEGVNVENFDVPKELSAAKLKKATEQALMDAEKIKNDATADMALNLQNKAHVHPDAALTAVKQQLGLAVDEEIRKITITDLDKAATSVAAMLVRVLGGRTR